MENFFIRYKNPLVLMAVLFIQIVALATQVKRDNSHAAANSGGTRLIRVWTVTAITPFEKALVSTGHFFRRNWNNYIDLHNARNENRDLHEEIARLKLDQIRYKQDAEQAQRLQALLGFKQNYVGQIMAAQVIGTSGTEQSRMITIDKGSNDHVVVDMPVITPDGVVGKVKEIYPNSSHVLLINDRDSGAGVILQGSRLQGILKGTPQGELRVSDIMSDESIQVGEQVVTSGGDRVYPKGVPVGTISSVAPDHENDPFLLIKVRPAADLARLEEVLVVTKPVDELPKSVAGAGSQLRAADILAQRLPGVNKADSTTKGGTAKPATGAATPGATPATAVPLSAKPSATPSARPTPVATPSTTGAATTGAAAAAGNAAAGAGNTTAPKPASAATKKSATGPGTNATTGGTSGATGTTTPGSPAGGNISGSGAAPGASPTPTPKPKPPAKKAPPKATPTPSTDQPESNPAATPTATPETEKPPR